MISICVTHLDRCRVPDGKGNTLELFPDMVDCVAKAAEALDEELEFIVSDWGTTDWPLEDWLPARIGCPYKIIEVSKDIPRYKKIIDRGMGRNIAARNAKGKYLCFLDADMLFNYQYILDAQSFARIHRPYFPIIFYALNRNNKLGTWDKNGSGNCMILRGDFLKTGGWPCLPHYRKFHGQDVEFRKNTARKRGIILKRQQNKNIYHPYHPGKMITKANKRKTKKVPRRFDLWEHV